MLLSLCEIRTIVRSILEKKEEEELLSRWAGDWIDRGLSKIGAYPVPRGANFTSSFDVGSSNEVREVVWKGKRAVARLSTNPDEQEAMVHFVSFKDKLPKRWRVHFPVIYTTFELEDPESGYIVFGTIGEMLDPLPAALKADLDSLSYDSTIPMSRVEALENDKEKLRQIAILEPGQNDIRTKAIMKAIEEIAFPFIRNFSKMGQQVLNLKDELSKELSSTLDRVETDIITGRLEHFLRKEIIPVSKKLNEPLVNHPSKKVQNFHRFLIALDKAGKSWEDMHVDNFMMRRSTGDLVVVDPGLFT